MKCFDLTGKTAILTGAAGGLGEVFARALAEAGAQLFVAARKEEGLIRITDEIRGLGGDCYYRVCDITKESQARDTVKACIEKYGKVDILVNNAGAHRDNRTPFEIENESFKEVLDTNVMGALSLSKACAEDMMKRGWGRIVNIASLSGFIVNKGVHGGSYEVSKSALIMLTKALATEWCGHGICVNAIAPGYFGTQSNKNYFEADPTFYAKVVDMIPMGRLGEPEELAGPLVLLCSDAASYMQGFTLLVDGGYVCW
ncbi:MAG: glucose 1-dehydrogenase [Clostridiales bacterium]|nr:glucose 1-dehydrogenase [Clostridiales bacterium]